MRVTQKISQLSDFTSIKKREKLRMRFTSPLLNCPTPLSLQLQSLRRNLPSARPTIIPRAEMSLSSSKAENPFPSSPDKGFVLGCGAVSVDYLATVASFPKPDDKIRTTSLKVEGGGNAGNALTSAARLGLKPRLISKVANDTQGRGVLQELEQDGVDTSFMVVSEEGNSPFTYVIVDNETKTRTCINTPGYPPLGPNELSISKLFSALDGTQLVYFDGRLHETALVVAKEATQRKIPILVDAERKREGLDDLLNLATYVVCSEKFPQAWTGVSSIPSALVSMLLRLPDIKFVIVTRGDKGCIMLERGKKDACEAEEVEIGSLLESLMQESNGSSVIPTCISSKQNIRLRADGIGAINGSLLVGTAELIPPSELIDTTGAGDAFIGAVLYALCAGMAPEKMLPFASKVAAAGCKALGARSGLPFSTDPRLSLFWH
ncbi:putative fructokinase-3 [Apostasia shenzhenica]|uniref:Putative fructokinase-3 n=1 Tax=Apostasia shenzhenica TaxID=1088818 RepID=A0A2I0A938_9ASPA|nr:putative fructokinase-3 [Apostasia shenzhenica]